MPDAATDGSGYKTSTRTIVLPDVPPEDSLLHVVLEYRKQLDLALAEAKLLLLFCGCLWQDGIQYRIVHAAIGPAQRDGHVIPLCADTRGLARVGCQQLDLCDLFLLELQKQTVCL